MLIITSFAEIIYAFSWAKTVENRRARDQAADPLAWQRSFSSSKGMETFATVPRCNGELVPVDVTPTTACKGG